jgi:hypothetical protein
LPVTRAVCASTFSTCVEAIAHGRESLHIEQHRVLDEIAERRGADVQGSGVNGEGRVAFCRAVEIDQQAAAIMRKAAMRGRKADGIDRETDRCLRFVDAPALCRRRRLRLNAAQKDRQTNNAEPARDCTAIHVAIHDHVEKSERPREPMPKCVSIPEQACGTSNMRTETCPRDRPPTPRPLRRWTIIQFN